MKNIRQLLKESSLANVPKVDHYCGEEDVVMADAKDVSEEREKEIERRLKPFEKFKKGFTGASKDDRPISDDGVNKIAKEDKEELDESLFESDKKVNKNFDKKKYGKYFDKEGKLIPELKDKYLEVARKAKDPITEDYDDDDITDDGWSRKVQYILKDVFDTFEDFEYEIQNCVRGVNTKCTTHQELAFYIRNLAYELDNAANTIESYGRKLGESYKLTEDYDYDLARPNEKKLLDKISKLEINERELLMEIIQWLPDKTLGAIYKDLESYYFSDYEDEELTEAKGQRLTEVPGTISNILVKHKSSLSDTSKNLNELKAEVKELLKDQTGTKAEGIKNKFQNTKSVYDFISYVYNVILAGEGNKTIKNKALNNSLQEADTDIKIIKNKNKLFPTLYDEVMQRLARSQSDKANEASYKGIYDEEADLGVSLENIPNDREIGITVNAYFDDSELDWARKVAEQYDLYTKEINIDTPKVYDTDPIKQLILYVDTTEPASDFKTSSKENTSVITPYRDARDEIITKGKEAFEKSGGKIDVKGKGIWKSGYQDEDDKDISRELGYKIPERKKRTKKEAEEEGELEEALDPVTVAAVAPLVADTAKSIAPSVADVMKNKSDNFHGTVRELGGKIIDKIGNKPSNEELLNEMELEECDEDFEADDDVDEGLISSIGNELAGKLVDQVKNNSILNPLGL